MIFERVYLNILLLLFCPSFKVCLFFLKGSNCCCRWYFILDLVQDGIVNDQGGKKDLASCIFIKGRQIFLRKLVFRNTFLCTLLELNLLFISCSTGGSLQHVLKISSLLSKLQGEVSF